MAALFPLFLKLDGRKCVVVGAGSIATQKLDSLLHSGAVIQIIAPEANLEIQELVRSGQVLWMRAPFHPDHLEGALIVIAATGDPSVNKVVYQAARERGVLCNAVDEPEHCDFYYSAVVRRGDLQIAISTAGKSPALAQRIRKELEERFDASYISWLNWLGSVRELFFRLQVEPALRKRTLHGIAGRKVFERFKASREKRVQGGHDG